jgi:hypothetical protein
MDSKKKNTYISSLSSDHLMLINMNGPSLLEFDPATVVNHRYFGARTTKHVCDHKNGTDNQYWTCSGNCKRIF